MVLCNGAFSWGPTPGFPNHLGSTPLMGWRSWQAYGSEINQSLMVRTIEGLAKKRPVPGGETMSLADVGYTDVGLDSGYEEHSGVNGSCHDAAHHMIIDTQKFPSFADMNTRAHELNITTSWYLNSDGCTGGKEPFTTYTTDAADAVMYGFDGVKFDSEPGGPDHNITSWAEALNATGKQMMIENCLDKHPTYMLSNPSNCPFNFYRSGPDNSPSFYGGIAHVYYYAVPFLHTTIDGVPASRPGCYAYPDMLGIGAPIAGTRFRQEAEKRGCAQMTLDEERTLFANWAIISSPLVLGIDVGDDDVVEKYWPIIANTRALALHREWAGEAGRLLRESEQRKPGIDLIGATCRVQRSQVFPLELVYSKRLPGGRAAVLVINLGNVTLTGSSVSYSEALVASGLHAASAPLGFTVTDVWTGAELQAELNLAQPWMVPALAAHSSAFVILAAAAPTAAFITTV